MKAPGRLVAWALALSWCPPTTWARAEQLSQMCRGVGTPSDPCAGPHARTTPPAGAVVVDAAAAVLARGRSPGPSPQNTVFLTVSAAAAALDTNTTRPQTIFVLPGTYREQVYVPPLRGPLVVQGYTCDTRAYAANTVTLTHSLSLGDLQASSASAADANDDHTATLRLWTAGGLRIYNVNIANTFGPHPPAGGQALAVSAYSSDRAQSGQAFYGCQFHGYQDTLLAEAGAQLYVGCLVRGAVDFVFGQAAAAWLDRCVIEVVGPGCITASGRATDASPSWYVVHNSTVRAAATDDSSIVGAPAGPPPGSLTGKAFLGRPWADHARVVFQHTYLGDVVAPAGWSAWSRTNARTAHVFFGEHANHGPGAAAAAAAAAATPHGPHGPHGPHVQPGLGRASSSPTAVQRAQFSRQLAAPVDVAVVLGRAWATQWWVDRTWLA